MSNKKLHLVFGFVLAAFVGLIWSFVSAVNFKIDLWGMGSVKPSQMRPNMMLIHFKDMWNDFGWFIYFSNGITSTGDVNDGKFYVQTSLADAVECRQMVKWFYYNAERWERLWPLDPNTATSWNMNLNFSGWLYTRCNGSWYEAALEDECWSLNQESGLEDCKKRVGNKFVDTHGYYGNITHIYSWLTFWLVVWTNYNYSTTKWVYPTTPLTGSLVRINNQYPVGFVYDSNGWAWFIWCELKSVGLKTLYDNYKNNGNKWQGVFDINGGWTGVRYVPNEFGLECGWSAKNTLISVIVDWLVWITSDIGGENSGIEWNQWNEKMQYFYSLDINNIKLINYARQKAEILCRWKRKPWFNLDDWLRSDIICLSGVDITATQSYWIKNSDKTLILRGGNVTVNNMTDFGEKNYDMFIDNGNLVIEDKWWDLKVFKKNWFINEGMSSGAFSNQVNSVWDYTWDEVAAWKFIKGNFIVDWHITYPEGNELKNVYFIYWKLTTLDSVEDLKNTFKWKCTVWTGSDGTPCPMSIEMEDGERWENPYEWASLVIIDQNYPSPLYN